MRGDREPGPATQHLKLIDNCEAVIPHLGGDHVGLVAQVGRIDPVRQLGHP